MPPNFRRFLPIMLVAVLLLFVLPQILGKKSSGPSSSDRTTKTLDAMNRIDKAEQAYMAANGRYTSHLADLVPLASSALRDDLSIGIGVQIDASTDGHGFYAQVTSDVLSLTRGRTDAKRTANTCVVLKSGSGVKCPAST